MRITNNNLVGFGLALTLSGAVVAAPELKGTPDELNDFLKEPVAAVKITGSADESANSDIAKISLVVVTESKQLAEALSANANLRATVTQNFITAGIPAEKITNSKFSTSPQFGWFGDKPKGYEVVNRMQVKVTNESHMNAVAAAADENPEIDFYEIKFEHSKKKELEAQVQQQALDDAIRQKQFYETQLGLKLLPVSFATQNVRPVQSRLARSHLEEITVTARKRSASPLTFDEVKYRATVTVTYEIERVE